MRCDRHSSSAAAEHRAFRSRCPTTRSSSRPTSGLAEANRLGVRVDLLVGDLDSVDARPTSRPSRRGGGEVRRHPEDKDATDLDLAIAEAIAAGASSGCSSWAATTAGSTTCWATLLVLASPALRGRRDRRGVRRRAGARGAGPAGAHGRPGGAGEPVRARWAGPGCPHRGAPVAARGRRRWNRARASGSATGSWRTGVGRGRTTGSCSRCVRASRITHEVAAARRDLLLAIALLAAACTGDGRRRTGTIRAARPSRVTVTLLTHDSFDVSRRGRPRVRARERHRAAHRAGGRCRAAREPRDPHGRQPRGRRPVRHRRQPAAEGGRGVGLRAVRVAGALARRRRVRARPARTR